MAAGQPGQIWPRLAEMRAPIAARWELVTFPDVMSCRAMSRARLEGIANPIPCACAPLCGLAAARVGMPITSPAEFTSAPPLLPGLMAASVWMKSS